MSDLTAIVVDFYTRSLTLRLVEELLQDERIARVVVVDNSGDRTHQCAWPRVDGMDVVCSPERKGYGAGVNQALSRVSTEYVLICNSDLTVASGNPSQLIDMITGDVALVGPTILGPDGVAQRDASGRFPDLPLGQQHRPAWLTGACFAMRRADFAALGGFDERFDMYWEDVDLCRRLWASGGTVATSEDVVVQHASGASQASSLAQYRAASESRRRYLAKWGASRRLRLTAGLRRVLRIVWIRVSRR